MVESTRAGHEGEREEIAYDFLVNATGPKLNFGATEGLGPGRHSLSVCTETHAEETARALDESVARVERGERQRFLVGTGHGACLRGRRPRVHRQPRVRAAGPQGARAGGNRLDHQRVNLKMLRIIRRSHAGH